MFTLSILDQSPIPEGATGRDALQNSLDLALLADSLHYHRDWVAEHHATPGLACCAPEVLTPLLASHTKHIRVGSGGIMLPHYSPLKVAECFSMLSALFPDRIDLGIGRAAGTDPRTTFALQRDRRERSPDDFPSQLDELIGYLHGTLPEDHPFARHIPTLPGSPHHPQIHLLGSSPQSSLWAANLGLPYCFADFISPFNPDLTKRYRATFKPNAQLESPHVGVALWTICAPTDEEAVFLSSSFKMMMILMHQGRLIPVPPPEKAAAFLADSGDAFPLARRIIAGSPRTIRPAIEQVAHEYQADEVFLVNILHDHQARRRSYELVAQSFNLTPAPVGSAVRTATPTST